MIPTDDERAGTGEPSYFIYTCDGYRIEYLAPNDPLWQGVSLSPNRNEARLFRDGKKLTTVISSLNAEFGGTRVFLAARLS